MISIMNFLSNMKANLFILENKKNNSQNLMNNLLKLLNNKKNKLKKWELKCLIFEINYINNSLRIKKLLKNKKKILKN